MFIKENLTCAEIWWSLKTVESKFSLRSYQGTNALFCEIFPDSKIAHSFSIWRARCNYILNFGLAPFFKTILFIEMKKSPYFQTILDENLNKRLQRGQIDILISFRMKMIKKLIPDTSILNFLMEPLQPISEKPSCQESKSLTKITFYKSCQMDQM